MATLLAKTERTIAGGRSPLGWSTTGGGHWAVWDRFLTVGGTPAYHLGNICGTCGFLFERLPGATAGVDVDGISTSLARGLDSLRTDVVEALAQIMPAGDYRILLLRLAPRLAAPGGGDDYFSNEQIENEGGADRFQGPPHDPKISYYRVEGRSDFPSPAFRPEHGRGFDFLVPMFPETVLDPGRVGFYEAAIAEGIVPTAVSLSVLDVKGPAECGTDHWCMAHYLVDGHHKVAAAARAGSEVGLLAFVATDKGLSSPEEVGKFVRTYR